MLDVLFISALSILPSDWKSEVRQEALNTAGLTGRVTEVCVNNDCITIDRSAEEPVKFITAVHTGGFGTGAFPKIPTVHYEAENPPKDAIKPTEPNPPASQNPEPRKRAAKKLDELLHLT